MTYRSKFYNPFISTIGWDEVKSKVEEHFPDRFLVGYAKSPTRLRRNMVMYCVNLIQHDGKVAIALGNSAIQRMNSPWHSHTYARKAIEVLCEEGIITLTKGYFSAKFGTGFATQIEITERFTTMFEGVKGQIPVLDVNSNKIPSVQFEDTSFYNIGNDWMKMTERKVERLNREYFSQIRLSTPIGVKQEFLGNVWLTRIFGEEENSCGRFFQKYGTSYQNIPREDRSRMLLNNQETIEVDFSGMHINLLYHRQGLNNPHKDSYNPILEALALPSTMRKVIKQCVLVLINAPTYKSYICSFNKDAEGRKMVKDLKEYGVSLKDVLEAVKTIHSGIASYLHSNASLSLMFEESEIMQSILLSLHKMEVFGLPLHDAVICQKKDVHTVANVMQEEYKMATGFMIPVEAK
jgi:hypothetical protein